MIDLMNHLNLLGMKVEDMVTGYKGVVTSVTFDLYGCIQALVNPGTTPEGKLQDSMWLDVNRVKVTSEKPVMERPKFEWSPENVAKGEKGPAEKPSCFKP